jgi:cytidylate kinase
MYGLEACINVTEIEHNRILNILSNKPKSANINMSLNALMLRAKFNPQRHYEIYMIDVDDSISKDDLVDFFKETPQSAADLVRSRGQKIYSDRKSKSEKNMIVIE